jgi:hypothetical protein
MEKLSKKLMNAVLMIAAMFIFSSCNDELDEILMKMLKITSRKQLLLTEG